MSVTTSPANERALRAQAAGLSFGERRDVDAGYAVTSIPVEPSLSPSLSPPA
jgi:hypothetical protein